MRIAINLQRDHWRSRRTQFWRDMCKNELVVDETCALLSSCGRSPEQHVAASEQVQQLWSVVERLTEKQRTLFLLRYVEEMNVTEIAQVTGLQKGTVKSHISRALLKVRNELKERKRYRQRFRGER